MGASWQNAMPFYQISAALFNFFYLVPETDIVLRAMHGVNGAAI
jgi:hypothetical protein